MITPGRKHKPKDQLLSKPVKLQSDPVFCDRIGEEDLPADEPAAAEPVRREMS